MERFPTSAASISNPVQFHYFEDDNWDPFAPCTTPQQWQLCCSLVDTNLRKTILNNILHWRLIVPTANAKHPDQLYQPIENMEEWMDLYAEGNRVLLILKESYSGLEL